MKKLLCLAPLLWATGLPAQVSVEVVFEQEQYLTGEKVVAAVRITNRSGQTIKLGAEPDWLTFSVESATGLVLPNHGDPPVQGEFTLESSKRATKRVDLFPWFPLTTPGRYNVTASVKFKDWGIERASQPSGFNVINGAKLWEQEFGVPNSNPGETSQPEVRRYILQQANFIKANLRLYLRVTDASGDKVFHVAPIGQLLSFSRPEAQVDQESSLHVLYMDGPQTLSYTRWNPDGELLLRQTYLFTETRPRLRLKEGKVSVSGGVRQESTKDFPPPKPTNPEAEQGLEDARSPGPTNATSTRAETP
jgi:hypothetical protein